MKTLTAIACLSLLTGCASMTPTQKRVAVVVGSALAVGAVAAHGSSSPTLQPMHDKKCYTPPAKSSAIYHCK